MPSLKGSPHSLTEGCNLINSSLSVFSEEFLVGCVSKPLGLLKTIKFSFSYKILRLFILKLRNNKKKNSNTNERVSNIKTRDE